MGSPRPIDLIKTLSPIKQFFSSPRKRFCNEKSKSCFLSVTFACRSFIFLWRAREGLGGFRKHETFASGGLGCMDGVYRV